MREAGVIRINHGLCLELTAALWMLLAIGEDLMDEATQAEFVNRARRQVAEPVLPKRRSRTCDRKVRQPVRKWPRMIDPISVTSEIVISVEPIT